MFFFFLGHTQSHLVLSSIWHTQKGGLPGLFNTTLIPHPWKPVPSYTSRWRQVSADEFEGNLPISQLTSIKSSQSRCFMDYSRADGSILKPADEVLLQRSAFLSSTATAMQPCLSVSPLSDGFQTMLWSLTQATWLQSLQ